MACEPAAQRTCTEPRHLPADIYEQMASAPISNEADNAAITHYLEVCARPPALMPAPAALLGERA